MAYCQNKAHKYLIYIYILVNYEVAEIMIVKMSDKPQFFF